jgi:hypothetical protein
MGFGLVNDLLIAYTHHLELQVATALSLISTLYKSLEHPLSLSPACFVFISHSLAMASKHGGFSASRTHIITVQKISCN